MRYLNLFWCTTIWFTVFTGLVFADTDVQPIEANSTIEYKDFSYMVISVSDNADNPSQPQGQISFTWISSRDINGSNLIHNINAKSGEMDFNDAGPGIYYVTLTVTKYGGGESTSVTRKICIGKEVYEQSCKGGTGDNDSFDDETTASDNTTSLDCYIVAYIPEKNQTYGKNKDTIVFENDVFSIEAYVKDEACAEKYSIGIREYLNPQSLVSLYDTNVYAFSKMDIYEILILDENNKVHFESAKKIVVIRDRINTDNSASSETCNISVNFSSEQSKLFSVNVTPDNSDYDVNLQLSNPSYGIFGDGCFKPELHIDVNSAEISLAKINQYDTLTARVTDNNDSQVVAECSVDLTQYRYNSTLMVHSYVKNEDMCRERNYTHTNSNGIPSLLYKIGETIKLNLYVDKDKLGTCADSANISAKIFFDGGPLSLMATNSFGGIDNYYGSPVKQIDNLILPALLDYTLASELENEYTFEISLRDENGDYCKYAGEPIAKSFVVDVIS